MDNELKNWQVRRIRAMRSLDIPIQDICDRFNISRSTVEGIIYGRFYQYIDNEISPRHGEYKYRNEISNPDTIRACELLEDVEYTDPPPYVSITLGPCIISNKAYVGATGYAFAYDKLAHRTVFSGLIGSIPKGIHVCHRCDNPACINPEHLFLGTAKDNMRDRDIKGRGMAGRGREKIGDWVAIGIRWYYSHGISTKILTNTFGTAHGVSYGAIRSVIKNESYQWD